MTVRARVFGMSGVVARGVSANSLAELIKELSQAERIDMRTLKDMKIFVNGNRVYRAELNDGDDVIFLSPSAGG